MFTALFGPTGLLQNKSVILATNQVYRFANASYLTVLHEGRIVEQGVYSTLLANDGLMSKLVKEFAAGKKDEHEEEIVAKAETRDSHLGEPIEEALEPQNTKEGVQGAVKWKTYLWYLRGMGYVYAGFCE